MATNFTFEILTLQKQFLKEPVQFVIAPGEDGVFEILANHAPFVFGLKSGVLHIRRADGKDFYIAIHGGLLVTQKNGTTVLTRSAERPEDIDKARAQRAKERAEKRIREQSPDTDMARARASLARAVTRLKVLELWGKAH
jgi:F-type H+-transporting ATPase subunit epsilon